MRTTQHEDEALTARGRLQHDSTPQLGEETMTQYQQQPQPDLPYPGWQPPKQTHAGRNAVLAALGAALLAVVILVTAAVVTNGGSTQQPQLTGHQVWYRADGDGTTEASYTLRSDDGGTVQGDINLPLVNKAGETGLTFTRFDSGDFVYLSVQNATAAGAVTCQIVVDGVVISKNTSSGGYKIASCSSRVP